MKMLERLSIIREFDLHNHSHKSAPVHSYHLQFMSLTRNDSAVFSEHLYTEKVQVQNKIETSIIVVVVRLNLYNDHVIFAKE